jgi:serpin B
MLRRSAAAAAAIVLALACIQAAQAGSPPAAAAAQAENAFALSLLNRLGGTTNLVFSPYSVDTALTMVDAGAGGSTAAQIDRVLHAPSSASATADAGALRDAITAALNAGAANAPTLETANALWTQQGVALGQRFVTTLADDFGAPPMATNFRGAAETARQTINAWVSQRTASLIPSLLPPGSVSSQTVFVLANAIYLKAHWASPFASALTHAAPFTTAAGRQVSAQFMTMDDAGFRYASGAHYQAVDLPYQSSSLSLLAILPTGESMAKLTPTLNAATLRALVVSLHVRRVDLRMPKIHLRTQASLNEPLAALGMPAAFAPSADFRGITARVPLWISLVEHAADLKVDEQGTVAAAATGITGPTAIALPPGPPVVVNLDRPYLLLLREDSSGAILFAARVDDPTAG